MVQTHALLKTTWLILFFLLCTALSNQTTQAKEVQNWDDIVRAARGQTVDWYMWGGSPAVNTYVNGFLQKELKNRYGIVLRQVPVTDISEVISKLIVEKQAKKDSGGSVDLMWINGENFRTCKQAQLLYGPFAQKLPNQQYVDWSKPTVNSDFGTPVEGMESPWGSAQMVMIYDTVRTPQPPKSVATLLEWIKSNPHRFTYPAPPDFTGSVFIRHIFYHAAGKVDSWQNSYSEEELLMSADTTYDILRELKPSLWRQGDTYPDSPVKLNSLFADGEIDFSFSYSQGEASQNILNGIFPDTTRTYVFDEGTIANTHFVAIPYNAEDKAAAMVVANFLLSPEAQLHKAAPEVWGDFPVVDIDRLPAEWQTRFRDRPSGSATLSDRDLQSHQLPELPSKILMMLEKGWEEHVLKGR